MALAKERCEACTGATPTVEGAELDALRAQLSPEWEVDGVRLRRRMRFPDFAAAFSFATRVALIAEGEGHHPDMAVGWGRVEIELTTHAVKGLTRNDFILAARIDAAAG
ncbi:MAG TPA: 4a-hydroxytetrahydrobiopterin dehydratase [Candidatus Dormibacteraeota bacterium]|jgi:4a-hydroxytetrahydrobiopterin dehydratase|nr:4a-hydroxytetrahydrobiopterin dehydratase [Candidatus Dormibacteraeota bacterium]